MAAHGGSVEDSHALNHVLSYATVSEILKCPRVWAVEARLGSGLKSADAATMPQRSWRKFGSFAQPAGAE